jgi:hypothetical protein
MPIRDLQLYLEAGKEHSTEGYIYSLFVWLVADGWCWFVLREKYCWLVCSEIKVLLAGG